MLLSSAFGDGTLSLFAWTVTTAATLAKPNPGPLTAGAGEETIAPARDGFEFEKIVPKNAAPLTSETNSIDDKLRLMGPPQQMLFTNHLRINAESNLTAG